MKKAIVTGITGQDGAYLSKWLLSKGYKVYGTYRRAASLNLWRIEELGISDDKNFELMEFDLTDPTCAIRLVDKCEPDEIYNLAAQSFVGVSFDQPLATAEITGLGALNLLEAIRIVNTNVRFYQASTSEMFGMVQEIPQTERTPFYPRSPYGVAKLYAHWMTINYRESYEIFGTCGILFNHESPLRGLEFVTRKITNTVAKILLKKKKVLELGNLNARRDWGYAADYVKGMWQMLQMNEPGEYVLATNQTTSVRDFVKMAFSCAGMDIEFRGEGISEYAVDLNSGETVVRVNPSFYRPAEVDLLVGDYSKAKKDFGWEPTVKLEQLCQMMVDADIKKENL